MAVDTVITTTHDVTNQPPPLVDYDLFSANRPLVEAVEREGAGWARERCAEVGRRWGTQEVQEWGRLANENPPRLKTHDRYGNRIDEVEFHPSYHELMALSSEHELHSLPWTCERDGGYALKAALTMCATADAGHGCPITMTSAAIPPLRSTPEIAAEWEPLLMARGYDGELRPAHEKGSAKCGMAMTEKQGGSDVRANTTRAEPEGDWWRITGHKWFCSAPMCDLFLVLAQTDAGTADEVGGGITCFAVPRILPDGTRNTFRLQRLKDKLGNRSNASSEVEFAGTYGQVLGEPGRGVRTIIDMVIHTRLDCVVGSAAGMRVAVANATWHAAHRSAFGKVLIDQPLMSNVLADLCIESEAATALAMRLARAYDEHDTALMRLGTAVGKYWVCKRFPGLACEAMECLGGNGYVEESGMPRIYREAPLNSIWEGSGNVNALDVLRALAKSPEALEGFFAEVETAAGADPRLDAFVTSVRDEFGDVEAVETRARRIVERMALALQGSLLVRHAPAPVADAFCASRLAGDGGLAYGTLPAGIDTREIVERHLPTL
jgi:putative acyl-CoA dehydrogenase